MSSENNTKDCHDFVPEDTMASVDLHFDEEYSVGGKNVKYDSDDVENSTSPHLSQSKQQSSSVPPELGNGFGARVAKFIARNPRTLLTLFMVTSAVLSGIGMIVGDFSISANTGGWQSRGTTIANRQTQLMLTEVNTGKLFHGGDAVWDDLITNVQLGWEVADDYEDDSRRLESDSSDLTNDNSIMNYQKNRSLPFQLTPELKRKLQLNVEDNGCDLDFYTSRSLTSTSRLWPLWKANSRTDSALDPDVLRDICEAEANTQALLEEKGLCFGCDVGCLPPYSIVLYARLTVDDGFSLSCDELATAWEPFQANVEEEWITCVADIKTFYDVSLDESLPESCPPYFGTELVEFDFDQDGKTLYTSSIFATIEDPDALYDQVDNYDRGSGTVSGAYDTQNGNFVGIFLDIVLISDMMLALSSSIVVATAIILHTRSPFLTIMGLMQIIFSFPLSYFFYTMILGFNYFPFLNFIGIFVVFALGAGDVFIAVDKWKNAKFLYPDADTEYIAAVAFPDAATSMLLTTTTTAVAFFATAICPVAPIKMFAIFCGLLIVFDYIMNMLLVFPALCIHDEAIREKGITGVSCCMNLSYSSCSNKSNKTSDEDPAAFNSNNSLETSMEMAKRIGNGRVQLESEQGKQEEQGEQKEQEYSLRRAFLYYYDNILHKYRWAIFGTSMAIMAMCTFFASKLDLPTSSDVRLLGNDVQFEQNYQWRQHLLSTELEKSSGSRASLIWGVTPADTGDLNDPDTWSQLVLDSDFDPSSEEAQVYLLEICDELFAQEFATELTPNFICSMQKFDTWLQEQSTIRDNDDDDSIVNDNNNKNNNTSLTTDDDDDDNAIDDDIYTTYCNGATGIPVDPDSFHECMIAWSQSVNETFVLSYQNKVTILYIPFTSRVRYDDSYNTLDAEWNLIENWVQNTMQHEAPIGVHQAYFSSFDFWWYDTSGSMVVGAYSSVAIAISCAALVILIVTRSLTVTFFATVTIWYVLVSVTAMLVGLGWTLGFLESVCFAILIGVSVDFVIHFSYAYSIAAIGDVDRSIRTKYALLSMGRSILSTALATIISSCIMLFTVILFFQNFGLILVLTIVQACVGSFVVFLSMVDCIGPTNPTYLADKLMNYFSKNSNEEQEVEVENEEDCEKKEDGEKKEEEDDNY